MTRPLVGTILPDDYAEIKYGVEAAARAASILKQNNMPVIVPHEHRYWEYGSAISAMAQVFGERLPETEVLDIGSGPGIMGPAVVIAFNSKVTECEPDLGCWQIRQQISNLLTNAGRKSIEALPVGFGSLPNKQYDVVTCISVIEHVQDEKAVWAELATKVKQNGLLFITTDCVEERGKSYMCDEYRTHNYTLDELQERTKILTDLGFTTMGVPDWNWNGARVYDYTFWRGGFIKNGEIKECA